jgi:predicted permease
LFSSFMQDVRYAHRQLRNNAGFTAVAVLTLALGIGANTAIFSLLNAVLLRNLPIRQPEQLMLFGKGAWKGSVDDLPNRSWQLFSYPFFREFRQKNQVFSEVAAIDSIMFSPHGRVSDGTNLEKINAELVSGTYFDTLGVSPVLGRVLTDADDGAPGGHPVAVASYSWWQRRFAKDANVIGKTVTIRSTVYTVIGVAPPDFFGVTVGQSPDLWIPLAMEKEISPGWNGLNENLFQSLYIFARRKPNVSAEQAGANTNLLFKQIVRQYAGAQPSQKQLDGIQHAEIVLTPAAKGLSQLRDEFSSPLKILMAVVALVLLVACANVANLLLARASARQREVAVRMAMGAARLRLIRQLMVESTLLGATGAILGFWLAWGATQILPRMVSAGSEPAPIRITPDIAVLGFNVLVSVFTVLLFGTMPALSATRVELVTSLKEGRGTTYTRSRSRLARGLIVGQVALSLILLAGAGLFLRTLVNLTNVDTGFNRQNVLTTSVDPDGAGYQQDVRWNGVMDQIEERVNALPGIRAASFAFSVFNEGSWTDGVIVPGRPHQEHDPEVDHNIVGPRYFEAMGMPIVLGRTLLPEDVLKSRHVAVINEMMARTYFGNDSPLGRTFSVGGEPGTQTGSSEWLNLEVVGVVKNAKYTDLNEKQMPAAFYPHSQHPEFLYALIARYSGDPRSLAQAIGTTIHNIDPNLPVGEFSTLERLVDDSVLNHRLVAQLCTVFGVFASLLAAIGIYGLMSYGVTRRTNEFGVRLALGAHRHHVVWLVLRETLVLVMIGIALGLAAAPAIGRIVASFLFGLKFYDPMSIGVAVLAMIAVALLAGYIPARRAAKVDPMVALRYE